MTPSIISHALVHKSYIRFRPRIDAKVHGNAPKVYYAICLVAGKESLWVIMKENGKFLSYAGNFKQVKEIIPEQFTYSRVRASWAFYQEGALNYRQQIEKVKS